MIVMQLQKISDPSIDGTCHYREFRMLVLMTT